MTNNDFINEYIGLGGSAQEAERICAHFDGSLDRDFHLALAIFAVKYSDKK